MDTGMLNTERNRPRPIEELLSLLHGENSTQYYTLIKMHLSFATDLSSDQCNGSFDTSSVNSNKWNLSPMRRFLRANGMNRQSSENPLQSQDVVLQVFNLIDFLGKNENIVQEGLFRKTGSVARQNDLKAALLLGKDLNLECSNYSAHDCASVLKSFFADLPEPLLQEGQYHVHCRITEMCGQNLSKDQQSAMYLRRIKALRLVFLLLPTTNYEILKRLLILLHRVTTFQDVNKMSSLNLGTMFGPHILCPRKVSPNELQYLSASLSTAVAFIIENASQLFEIPSELEIDVREYFRTSTIDRQLSKKSLEEAATKTTFSFVNRELTAKETNENMTEMALAELYAYVRSLPDSAKKRKLIGQFNDVSGQGTPKYNQSSYKKPEFSVKSLSDSIKKHLFSRSSKGAKSKKIIPNQLTIKRSNSEDILGTSSILCTPELGSQKSPKTKAKSLDNLFSPKGRTERISPCDLYSNNENLNSETDVSRPSSHFTLTSTPVSKGSFGNIISSDSFTNVTGTADSCDTLNETASSGLGTADPSDGLIAEGSSIISPGSLACNSFSGTPLRKFSVNKVAATTEFLENSAAESGLRCQSNTGTSSLTNTENEKSSPISRAMRNISGHQRVMMTPRSRCPIIINSTSSLSSVAIHEENENTPESKARKISNISNADDTCASKSLSHLVDASSPNISSVQLDSGIVTPLQSNRSVQDDSRLPEIPNRASSHRLRGFFKYLSTSSLLQIASRLTSPSTFQSPSSVASDSILQTTAFSEENNESLSSVFKDYLLGRSIIANNPADNSSRNTIDMSGEQSSTQIDYSECLPVDVDQLKDSLSRKPKFSNSLLFCLDGNNPFDENRAPKRPSSHESEVENTSPPKRSKMTDEEGAGSQLSSKNPLSENINLTTATLEQSTSPQPKPLYSCSPDGRVSSFFKNRNGTPVHRREKENDQDALKTTKSVLYETQL